MIRSAPTRLSPRQRRVAVALAVIVVAVFAAANAHLVVISLASQPPCVEDGGAALRAANRSC
jgi:hypothetical protein